VSLLAAGVARHLTSFISTAIVGVIKTTAPKNKATLLEDWKKI